MNRRIAIFVALCGLILLASNAWAGFGTIPYLYGFGARGAALGQTYTALADDASSAFFNPAAMATLDHSNIALSYVYGQPEFHGGPQGNPTRFDAANNVVELNLAQRLNTLFKSDWPVVFGLNIALDDNGLAFIRFNDEQNANGNYYRYGPASFTLNFSLGWKILDWFYMGAGVMTTLHSKSTFFVDTDLTGKTSHQGISLDANLDMAPIVALFFRPKPVDIGVTYHGKTYGGFDPITVNATADVGKSPLASLPMVLYYKDNYIPQRIALGLYWHATSWLGVTADTVWYNWGDFNKEMSKFDMPRYETGFDFHDTYVPHVGLEFLPVDGLAVRCGYGYEQTPVARGGNSENMILDNSKHIAGVGIGYTFAKPAGLNYPLSLDGSYFMQYLVKRQEIANDATKEKYESSGMLNGLAGTLTIRY